jgi:hypothetical protein
MSSKLAFDNGVIPLAPTADQSALRGYFVENSSGSAAVCNAATDIPLGCIVDGATSTAGRSAIAICGSGVIAMVKVTGTSPGTITLGTYLTVKNDGTVQADAGSGGRVRVARAVEAGAAGELIAAVLIDPIALS